MNLLTNRFERFMQIWLIRLHKCNYLDVTNHVKGQVCCFYGVILQYVNQRVLFLPMLLSELDGSSSSDDAKSVFFWQLKDFC